MSTESGAPASKANKQAGSLGEVLARSEHARELVDECAQDLSAVNAGIKRELETLHPLPGVEDALKQSETVEEKILCASDQLSIVTSGLTGQVRDRSLLDLQFAAAVEQQEAACHTAMHDALTGLANRVLFNDRLEHAMAQAKRHRWYLAVMFIDLDRFKYINDTYGHDVGDRVLQTVAARLTDSIRSEDTISRYGGDEFLYLQSEVNSEADAALTAAKLLARIHEAMNVVVTPVDRPLTITASIGIAIFPKDGVAADMLIKHADTAMYRAKQNKSGYAFAD